MDQEQSGAGFFGEALKQAIATGQVPQARLNDMVHRILRTEFASGVVDKKMVEQVPDVFGDLDVAQRISEASDVLLKNNGVLCRVATWHQIFAIAPGYSIYARKAKSRAHLSFLIHPAVFRSPESALSGHTMTIS